MQALFGEQLYTYRAVNVLRTSGNDQVCLVVPDVLEAGTGTGTGTGFGTGTSTCTGADAGRAGHGGAGWSNVGVRLGSGVADST